MTNRNLTAEEKKLFIALIFGVVNAMMDTARELCRAEEKRCGLFAPTDKERKARPYEKRCTKGN